LFSAIFLFRFIQACIVGMFRAVIMWDKQPPHSATTTCASLYSCAFGSHLPLSLYNYPLQQLRRIPIYMAIGAAARAQGSWGCIRTAYLSDYATEMCISCDGQKTCQMCQMRIFDRDSTSEIHKCNQHRRWRRRWYLTATGIVEKNHRACFSRPLICGGYIQYIRH
jgi:hypothetical protein